MLNRITQSIFTFFQILEFADFLSKQTLKYLLSNAFLYGSENNFLRIACRDD